MRWRNAIRYFLLLAILAIVLDTNAQDNCSRLHNANWIWMGSDTGTLQRTTVQITFTHDTFIVDTVGRSMEIGSQNAMVSDSAGNLLFYSNGCYIANAMDVAIQHSDTLNPGSIFNSTCKGREGSYIGSQGMIVLNMPGTDSLFAVLHKKFEDVLIPSFHIITDRIFLTLVDPYKNSGLVIEKNVSVVADTNIASSNFSATRHADGVSWWILTPDAYGNGFFRILFTSSGYSVQDKQYIGDVTLPEIDAGQAKFSPDGSKFARYHAKSGGQIFDFDRQTGLLSNPRSFGPVDSTVIIGGCEFSPSGRFLYVNTMVDVYQYDTNVPEIAESRVHLGHYDGYLTPRGRATRFYHMERTPNGQIFLNCPNGVNVLHVIKNPDAKGAASNFTQHGIILPANIYWSMPHFPNYRLGALGDPPCDTVVSTTAMWSGWDDVVTVYPSPTSSVATFSFNPALSNPAILQIVDLQGRAVLTSSITRGADKHSVDVSGLPEAMYFYSVQEDGKVVGSGKVLVAR